jgi:hypothetical protein
MSNISEWSTLSVFAVIYNVYTSLLLIIEVIKS